MGSAISMVNAVSEAAVYNLMQRRPADFGLASRTLLYAYLAGLLSTDREHVVFTPAALILEMYATWDRCRSLEVEVRSDTFDVPPKAGFPGVQRASYVDVSARRHPDDRVDVFLVNRDLVESIHTEVAASGGVLPAKVAMTSLASKKITDWNTFENPTRVAPQTSTVVARDGRVTIDLPPHSVTRLSW
jgi:alpha-N-arabinofuranosidase